MAAGLFNAQRPGPAWQAASAGLSAWPNQPATDLAVRTLWDDYRIDIGDHRSRRLDLALLREADRVLTMSVRQRDYLRGWLPERAATIQTIGELAGQPEVEIPDPYGLDLAAYQDTAAALARLIDQILAGGELAF